MRYRNKERMPAPVPDVTLVVPVKNEEENLREFYKRASRVLHAHKLSHEILFVDDGSSDGSTGEIERLAAKDPRIRCLVFSRPFGKEAALSAGLLEARGGWVVPIDADLQDPPELIPAMMEHADRHGLDMVFARRASRPGETALRTALARLFYHLLEWATQMDIVPDSADFRVIRRPVVDAINSLPERNRYMKGLFRWVGFRQGAFPYEQAPRFRGKSKWSYGTLMGFGLQAVTGTSSRPLILFRTTAWILAFLCFISTPIVAILTHFSGSGGSWLIPTLWVLPLSGFQLTAVGLFSEYLRHLFDESKGRPLYVVSRRFPLR